MDFKNEIYILIISSIFSLLYYFYDKKTKSMSNVWDIQLKNIYTPLMIMFDTLSIDKKTLDEIIDYIYGIVIKNYTFCPFDIIDIILELKRNKHEFGIDEIKSKLKKLDGIIVKRYYNLQTKLLYNSIPGLYGLKLKLYIFIIFGYLIKYSVYVSFLMLFALFIFKPNHIHFAVFAHLMSYVFVYIYNFIYNKRLDKIIEELLENANHKID